MNKDMFSGIDKKKLMDSLSSAARGAGADAGSIKGALESGKIERVLSAIGPDKASKLQQLLSDKEALNKILSSPQAAKLLKELTK